MKQDIGLVQLPPTSEGQAALRVRNFQRSEGMPLPGMPCVLALGWMAGLFVALVVSIEQERQRGNAFFAYRLQFAGIDSKRLENRRRDL